MINIRKSQPAPGCLEQEKAKKSGTYRCGDVHQRLHADFFNKCYICEALAPSSIDIEHLISHRGDLNLKFGWENLFLACSHCNSCKQHWYDDILDCTDFSTVITDCIQFEINSFPKDRPRITALQSDSAITKTVRLLDKVYNGNTKKQKLEADNIRTSLIKEILKFSKLLNKYYKPGLGAIEKNKIRTEIARMLSPETAFTAFKIWVIKNNQERLQEFSSLLPQF